jgi:hypothetical protein
MIEKRNLLNQQERGLGSDLAGNRRHCHFSVMANAEGVDLYEDIEDPFFPVQRDDVAEVSQKE